MTAYDSGGTLPPPLDFVVPFVGRGEYVVNACVTRYNAAVLDLELNPEPSPGRQAMTVYKLATARVDRWKAWLTLNEIPPKQVVRDSLIRISDEAIAITEFATDRAGDRIRHTCECDGGGHLAKQVTQYDLLEMPGAWADVDLVTA